MWSDKGEGGLSSGGSDSGDADTFSVSAEVA
jgi:hypothetical protein